MEVPILLKKFLILLMSFVTVVWVSNAIRAQASSQCKVTINQTFYQYDTNGVKNAKKVQLNRLVNLGERLVLPIYEHYTTKHQNTQLTIDNDISIFPKYYANMAVVNIHYVDELNNQEIAKTQSLTKGSIYGKYIAESLEIKDYKLNQEDQLTGLITNEVQDVYITYHRVTDSNDASVPYYQKPDITNPKIPNHSEVSENQPNGQLQPDLGEDSNKDPEHNVSIRNETNDVANNYFNTENTISVDKSNVTNTKNINSEINYSQTTLTNLKQYKISHQTNNNSLKYVKRANSNKKQLYRRIKRRHSAQIKTTLPKTGEPDFSFYPMILLILLIYRMLKFKLIM